VQRLATVQRLQLRQGLRLRRDSVRQLQQAFRARFRRCLAPGIERPIRRLNGGIDLGRCRFGNLQDHIAGRRVIYRHLFAFTCH